MNAHFTILGLGEALFDVFPDKQVLGGAPLNVAVHAHQISQPRGGRGVVVSRVGQDPLGNLLLAELRKRGMTTDYVQSDPDRATGTVFVDLSDPASPSYDIVKGVAWDWIQFDPELEALASQCQAVCFGTLAQRESEARNAILRVLSAARRAVRLFDVNLRQDYFNAQIVRRSLEHCSAIKLNESELPIIADLLAFSASPTAPGKDLSERLACTLLKKFDLKLVALTRGAQGTLLLTPTGRFEAEVPRYEPEPGADSVGAGDACAAGILLGLVQRWSMDRTVHVANHLGAFVASRAGATPPLPQAVLDLTK